MAVLPELFDARLEGGPVDLVEGTIFFFGRRCREAAQLTGKRYLDDVLGRYDFLEYAPPQPRGPIDYACADVNRERSIVLSKNRECMLVIVGIPIVERETGKGNGVVTLDEPAAKFVQRDYLIAKLTDSDYGCFEKFRRDLEDPVGCESALLCWRSHTMQRKHHSDAAHVFT